MIDIKKTRNLDVCLPIKTLGSERSTKAFGIRGETLEKNSPLVRPWPPDRCHDWGKPKFSEGWNCWFQICFIFSPKIGEDEPNLTSIFFKGVLKPPTSDGVGSKAFKSFYFTYHLMRFLQMNELKLLVDLCWLSQNLLWMCVFSQQSSRFHYITNPSPLKGGGGDPQFLRENPCQRRREFPRAFRGGHGFSLWCFPLSIFSCSCCGCRSWRSWSWGRSPEVRFSRICWRIFLGRESLY